MRRFPFRSIATTVALALVAQVIPALPTVAAADPQRLRPQQDKSVPGHVLAAVPATPDAAAAHARTGMPAAPVWPKPATATFDAACTASARAAYPEVLLRVSRTAGDGPVSLSVDASAFGSAFGADWTQRLRLVALHGCDLSKPDCAGSPVPSRVTKDGWVTADVAADKTVYALTSGPAGTSGTFAATSLASSGAWTAGGSSGDFTWSYPLRTPPPLNGPAPEVTLSYSAQSVDGRTAASNNQPSWLGEGFDYSPGYIERQYKACNDDMNNGGNNTAKNGDECWGTDNATMSLGGKTVELIKDGATGTFHPKADDGSRVEHLTDTSLKGDGSNDGEGWDDNGEYWRVTTANGTQYYFGRQHLPGWAAGKPVTRSVWTVPVFGNNAGEPCHQATFDASSCQQAWRWNLDYVVDPHGNSMSLWYTAETNKYARNGNTAKPVTYTRGGELARIDYGTRSGGEYGNAPMQVVFTPANRCDTNCGTHGANWPDTPWDLSCTTTCQTGSPTFWITQRLASVTTKVNGAAVESWTFTHTYPDPGDATRAGLWLSTIGHSGLVGGTTTLPDIRFTGVQEANRVDTSSDQVPAMNWWRIQSITTESGGEIEVKYSAPECVAGSTMPSAPENNTLRCYPVKWTPDGWASQKLDYFHKYVVTDVTETDLTGGAPRTLTHYDYPGTPAWHYVDDDGLVAQSQKTWSQWRGYQQVQVTKGQSGSTQSRGVTTYFRGMDGDHLPTGTRSVTVTDSENTKVADSDALAGQPREAITYNGPGGPEISGTITDPWMSAPTATRTINGVTVYARYAGPAAVRTRTALDGGRGYLRTRTATQYDQYGLPIAQDDYGDEATPDDDQCVRTTYARNTGAWLISFVSEVRTTALSCDKTPTTADQVIGDGRTSYDGQTWGTAPTKGDVTKVEAMADWVNNAPTFFTTTTSSYDDYGRVTDSWDVKKGHATNAYSPATGAVTKVTATNEKGFVTATDYQPAWGVEAGETDPNGRRTDLAYDPLGRLTSVWLPGRDKTTYPTDPNTGYSYLIRSSGATAVTTSSLLPNGNRQVSYQLYDGLLRPRQTQAPASGDTGGRVVTDNFYDTAGRLYKANSPYVADGAPSTDLFGPDNDNQVPSQTVSQFDGADRPVAQILMSLNVEKWRTTTSYGGDHTDVTPPTGGTATSTYTDARGHTTELRQYHGPTPTGAYDSTKYQYTPKNVLGAVTGPDGSTWTYRYDLRGRQIEVDDPDKGKSTSTYDDAGEQLTSTDARGHTIAYTYDELGRKTAEFDGSTSGPKLAEWTYDTLPDGKSAKGQQISAIRYVGANAYSSTVTALDDQYRPTSSKVVIPASEGVLAGKYVFGSTYNADGSVSTTTLPAAGGLAKETLITKYNDLGEPVWLDGLSSYVTDAQYTRLGEPSVYTTSANGPDEGPYAQNGRYYDTATRRLAETKTVRETNPSTIADVHYTWDPAGNLTQVNDTQTGDSQCYQYDHVQRLTQAWTGDCAQDPTASALTGPAPYWQSWTYDAGGNRRSEVDHATSQGDVTTTYGYPQAGQPQPHTLTSTTTTTNDAAGTHIVTKGYAYDAAGNTISRPSASGSAQQLVWNAEGRLDSVTEDGNTTDYVYDADGNRLVMHDPTGTTLYLPNMELRLAKNTTTPSCTRYYSFGDDGVIAQRTTSGVSWLMPDWQGTDEIDIATTTGQPVTQRRQTPFGGPRGTAVTWPNPHGFVGGDTDPTGLTHLGAREYDPDTGRFLSVDPMFDTSDPQQMEGYVYAGNSPITHSDPSGLMYREDGAREGWHQTYNDDDPGTAPSSQPSSPHPAQAKHCGGWWGSVSCFVKKTTHTTVNWVEHHKAEIAGVAAGLAAGAACELVTAGAGSIGCAALAGAIGSMVEYAVKTKVEHRGKFSWTGLALSGVEGAVTGALTAGLGAAGGKILGAGIKAAAESGAGRSAASAVERAAANSSKPFVRRAASMASKVINKVASKCENSFTPATAVLMADGTTKPIGDIKTGDKVLATDPATGATKAEPVDALIIGIGQKNMVDITVRTGADGKSDTITATDNHPIWVQNRQAWVNAGDLRPGDELRTATAELRTVQSVSTHSDHRQVNNLTVDTLHTYYVLAGNTPVLVHNAPPNCFIAGGPRIRPVKDIDVDGEGLVHPPSANDLGTLNVRGLSVFDSVDNLRASGLTGQVRAPNADLPDGLGMVADGANVGGPMPNGHSTIYPTTSMPFEQFDALVKGMNWQNIGVKLR